MRLHDYRFRSVWSVGAGRATVFDALADLARYPEWWPDIRSVDQVDEDTAEVACRAMLPYQLSFRMHRVEQDERTGTLRVNLTGDLEGYCHGVVDAERPDRSRLEIRQRVVVHKRLLRVLAPVARPLLRGNHAAMMWRGQRGLRSYLDAG